MRGWLYGGLIGASLATILYVRLKNLPLWKVADALAPSIALGSSFGRIGCLMNGCCYGKPTTMPCGESNFRCGMSRFRFWCIQHYRFTI